MTLNHPEPRVKVSLRPAEIADASLFKEWREEPEVYRYQPIERKTLKELQQELQNLSPLEHLREGKGHTFRWIVEADGHPAGWLTLSISSWKLGIAELAYSLSTPYQRQGIMPAAIRSFLVEVLEPTALRRLEACCAGPNEASCKMIERVGFQLEEPIHKRLEIHGETFDCRLYVLVLDRHRGAAEQAPSS